MKLYKKISILCRLYCYKELIIGFNKGPVLLTINKTHVATGW